MSSLPPLTITPQSDQDIYINPFHDKSQEQFTVTIQNPHKKTHYLYKMKLSNFELFSAQPYQGIIKPYETITVTVSLKKPAHIIDFNDPRGSYSKFLVEYGEYKEKYGDFAAAWANLHKDSVKAAELFKFHRFKAIVQQPIVVNGSTITPIPTNNTISRNVVNITAQNEEVLNTPSNRRESSSKTQPPMSEVMVQASQEPNPMRYLELKVLNNQKKIESLSYTITDYVMRMRQMEEQLKVLEKENMSLKQQNAHLEWDVNNLQYVTSSCELCRATLQSLERNGKGLRSSCNHAKK